MMRTVTALGAMLATLAMIAGAALADPLDAYKQQGLIGERPDGFVGFVVDEVPADLKKLVDRTNEERRAEYERLATKNGTSIDAVQALFGEKLMARQPSGTYVMTAEGAWIRK